MRTHQEASKGAFVTRLRTSVLKRTRLGLAATAVVAGVISAAAMASAAPSGGLPGATGTIDIHQTDTDDGTANQPQFACTFTAQFFGFAQGEQARLVFTAESPTGDGELLVDFG